MRPRSIAPLGCALAMLVGGQLGCSSDSVGVAGATGGVTATGGKADVGGSGGAGSGGATTGGASGVGGPSAGGAVGSGGSGTGGTTVPAGSGGKVGAGGAAGASRGGSIGSGGAQTGTGGSAGAGGQSGSVGSGGRTGQGGASGAGTGGAVGGSTLAGTGGGGPGGASGGGGAMPPVYTVENTGADCPVPTTFPAFGALKAIASFPDPFLMESGTRIASRSDWACRRAEISAQIQHWELGTKPAPPPASDLTATYSGGKLSVVVKVGSKSITLSTTISTPSGAGPFPALIQMDGSGVPASLFTSKGIATMTFTSSALASMMPTRGSGPFWDLFPDKTAGAYAGWAWGVSRLIDGLEKTADQNKIDTKHLAVSGCSYAGKMALWAGAFDERIALTIPEESGGGGEASWRFMATQTGTEDLEAAQGTGWYSSNLQQFKNADAPKLPFDQHSLVAMVAPRAVLAIGNTSIDRLGSQAGYASMKAAAEVYKALGVPERLGYSQVAAGSHCSGFSNSVQGPDVTAFIDAFLLGKAATPVTKSPYNPAMSKWITWDTPTLK